MGLSGEEQSGSFIGISEDRLHHCLGVARKCYALAKSEDFPEEFCRRMFTIGWNHDIGYEFAIDKAEHPVVSEALLKSIGMANDSRDSSKTLHAIRLHGRNATVKSSEWRILNMADMLIDSKGNEVTASQRLKDIATRFGEDSREFKQATELCELLQLVEESVEC